MRHIEVVTTGGTIEKIYSERTGKVANEALKIERYLSRLRLPDTTLNVTVAMNKDSLEMTDADRAALVEIVRPLLAECDALLMTHGTDTMVETGQYLRRALGEVRVPVVLTGAMAPLGFDGSDGLQNLAESLMAARLAAPGVYVVFHSQIFPVDAVRKDHALSTFVPAAPSGN